MTGLEWLLRGGPGPDDGICHWITRPRRGILPPLPNDPGKPLITKETLMRLILATATVLALGLGFGLPVQDRAAPEPSRSLASAPAPAAADWR